MKYLGLLVFTWAASMGSCMRYSLREALRNSEAPWYGSACCSGASEDSLTVEAAEKELQTADRFVIGPVGDGCSVSAQEIALRRLLGEPDALSRLKSLLERGQVIGQLYALCGLAALSEGTYRNELDRFLASERASTQIEIGEGCEYFYSVASEQIPRIQEACPNQF